MKVKSSISKIKVVFFGTPNFAAACLKYLLEKGIDVVAVVTQPDRPKGRSLQMTSSPVKEIVEGKMPVLQPEKASAPNFLEEIAKYNADLFVVVAFGQILSQKLLDIPPKGCINVHASLLPKYRGAAPIQRVLMNGEKETGIAIQKMVKQLDAGDVIAVSKLPLPEEMTFGELEANLLELAKLLLVDVIQKYEQGVPNAQPQDHDQASYAAKISMEEGEIHWNRKAFEIHNLIRAYSPRPGAWARLQNGKRVKILRSKLVPGHGQVGQLQANGVIFCGEGAIQLIEVQPEGKKVMPVADWLRGLPDASQIFSVLK